MASKQLGSKGFGIVGVLLIVIVLVGAGLAGYYVYRENHTRPSTKTTVASTSKNQSSNSSTSNNNSSTIAQPNVYDGWKSYCDTHNYCFKHPTDWTLDTTSSQVTVLNPDKSVEVDYIYAYVHDGGTLSFNPVSINDLSIAGDTVKIVGGTYLPADEPGYGVVDASLLNSYPLTVGQTTRFPNALRLKDTHAASSTDIAFRARATYQMSSLSSTQDWFNTAPAKTSLMILQSLSYQ